MNFELFLYAIATSALGVATGGCSSTPNPYPDVATFCSEKAKAICQASAICAVDPNACQASQVVACQKEANAATASGTRKYNSGAAGTCINAVRSAFGGGSSKVTYSQLVGAGSITDQCERVFSGGAAVGKSCATDYDCSGSLICAPVLPGSTSRVCAGASPVNQGDFCASPGQVCQTSYCAIQDSGAAQCAPLAMAGQPCSSTIPCVSGQRCLSGICQAAVGPAQPCLTSDDCEAADPYCDPYAGDICTLGLTFATGAADCTGFLLGEGPNIGVAGGLDGGADAPTP
jgi:hypothetical protein